MSESDTTGTKVIGILAFIVLIVLGALIDTKIAFLFMVLGVISLASSIK